MLVKLDNSNCNNEYCLLEFQGEIVGDLVGNVLGNIAIKEGGRAEMDIGQHFLEGKVIDLKSPFIIVENNNSNDRDSNSNSIEGYAKKKIIFNTRPKPIGLKRIL